MRLLASIVLVLALACPAMAGELAGVSMPDQVRVGDRELVLNGLALRKVVFFKVYVGGLYLPRPITDGAEVLANDGERRVVMHFLRSVGADDLSKAWLEGLEANTPEAPAEVRAQFETLCGWMSDVEEGDEMVVTYVPGEGTSVTMRGLPRGVLPGKAFADALFACWIGPEPGPGESFRKSMLGG